MEDLMEFVADEENTVMLMGTAATVAAVVVGGILMTSGPDKKEAADAAMAELTMSAGPTRTKKKQKKAKPSKPVLPKKKKPVVEDTRWASSSEEEEVIPEPIVVPKKKKGKKGKQGSQEEETPVEEEWSTVVAKKKVAMRKSSTAAASDGKVVLDLGESKPAVIGKKGAVIQGIQSTSGASIDMADKPSTKCTVTGTPEQVKKAVEMINAIIAPAGGTSETVSVGEKVGAVIGKKGANIQMIQTQSGAKVDVSRETNQVTISGDSAQVAKAKELVQAIVAGGPVGPPPEAEKRIETSSAGAVIGKGGQTIRKIQDESGARVDISKDSSGPDVITISGSKSAVEKAAKMVDAVLNPTYDVKEFMDVGVKGVPLVVGPKGVTIQSLQRDSGAKIDIQDDATVVGIFGTQASVTKAKKAIETLLAENLNEESMPITASDIGSIIGKGGETIRKVQTESGARVTVDRGDMAVKIGGNKTQVKAARQMLEKIIKEANALPAGHVQETVELPDYAVGSIIGKSGSNIKALESDTGVSVSIVRGSGGASDTCSVTGEKAAVATAMEKIQSTLEGQKKLQEEKAEKPKKREADGTEATVPEPQAETWGDNGEKGSW